MITSLACRVHSLHPYPGTENKGGKILTIFDGLKKINKKKKIDKKSYCLKFSQNVYCHSIQNGKKIIYKWRPTYTMTYTIERKKILFAFTDKRYL